MILIGKIRRTRIKTSPSAPLPTTNSTLIDTGANRGLRGKRPRTNRLSHGTTRDTSDSQTDHIRAPKDTHSGRRKTSPIKPQQSSLLSNLRFLLLGTLFVDALQWNVNGIRTRFPDLQTLIQNRDPAIVCLKETHLPPSLSRNVSGFTAHRCKRSDGETTDGYPRKAGICLLYID
jgi:hypothetical protein